jgi:RNA polymerase sigma-70 factor (ECF subfamily)
MPPSRVPTPTYDRSFEDVFNYYSKGLIVYTREYGLSQADAEDVVSEVFINYLERMDTVARESVKSYLFQSARNRSLNHLARMRVRSDYQDRVLRDREIDACFPEVFAEQELEELLARALDILTPQQRKVFTAHRLEKKSYREIADELGISVKTVDKHLEQSSRQIREYLSRALCLLMLFARTGL